MVRRMRRALAIVAILIAAFMVAWGATQQTAEAHTISKRDCVRFAQANPEPTAIDAYHRCRSWARDHAKRHACSVPARPLIPGLGIVRVKGHRADLHQRQMLTRILNVARRRHDSRKVALAMIAATITEASATNVDHGDRDSVGLFQIRKMHVPAGQPDRRRDPEWQARWFLVRARALADRWPGIGIGKLAQSVERSGFPERYREYVGEARWIVIVYLDGCSWIPTKPKR